MGHAENYSAMVAQRMREIAEYQEQARKDRQEQEALGHLRAGITAAVMNARVGVFPDGFDQERAAQAAWRAGRS